MQAQAPHTLDLTCSISIFSAAAFTPPAAAAAASVPLLPPDAQLRELLHEAPVLRPGLDAWAAGSGCTAGTRTTWWLAWLWIGTRGGLGEEEGVAWLRAGLGVEHTS